MLRYEWEYGFNGSLNFLIYDFICWNYTWKMHLCKYMLCLVDMVMQIYLIRAVLSPVLSQNGFRQRFAKPPLGLCTDPWTQYWILVKEEQHSSGFRVNLHGSDKIFFLLCTWGSKAIELFQRPNLAVGCHCSLRLGCWTAVIRFSNNR